MTPATLQRVFREKRRIAIPLALLAIANVVLYAVVVFPLQRQVAAAEVEANAQHDHLNAARFDLKNAKATVTADLVAFARANGLYGGVNLDGAVARQPPCNDAYYNGQGQQRAPSRHRYTQDGAEREVKRLASEVVNAAK